MGDMLRSPVNACSSVVGADISVVGDSGPWCAAYANGEVKRDDGNAVALGGARRVSGWATASGEPD